jgi:hypothetical protein
MSVYWESGGIASRLGRFTPRERAPGTQCIGGWVGPRAVRDAMVKREIPSPRQESNPRTPIVQPVAQRYTDKAVTALSLSLSIYIYIYIGSKILICLCSLFGIYLSSSECAYLRTSPPPPH